MSLILRIILQIQIICCVLLWDVLQILRLLLRYFQILILLMKFLLENLGMIVQHINQDDSVRFEPGNIKINRWLFGDLLGHGLDLVHEIVAFVLDIADD